MFFLWFGHLKKRALVLKLVCLAAISLLIYYLIFPGLFLTNFSTEMVMAAVMLRVIDLFKALGIESYFSSLSELAVVYRPSFVYVIGEGYSSVATLLRSDWLIPASLVMLICGIRYMHGVRRMAPMPTLVYTTTLLTCVLTQFAVPFIGATAFQLIVGFAIFPMLKINRPPRAKPVLVSPRIEQPRLASAKPEHR